MYHSSYAITLSILHTYGKYLVSGCGFFVKQRESWIYGCHIAPGSGSSLHGHNQDQVRGRCSTPCVCSKHPFTKSLPGLSVYCFFCTENVVYVAYFTSTLLHSSTGYQAWLDSALGNLTVAGSLVYEALACFAGLASATLSREGVYSRPSANIWLLELFFLFFFWAISRGKSRWERSCQLHRKHVSAECTSKRAHLLKSSGPFWNMTERSESNNQIYINPPSCLYDKNGLSLCCHRLSLCCRRL